ncbi:MAG: sigma-54-dependent Fis family transcriptional regulator [Deltaproteobacteria bacterium]|nr:sigma-54-dependent Fis family transcriptional regulator [Deltaproteobacteria bacterium]
MQAPLIGVSQNILRIKELIKQVADTGLNIVICGESGVGKEVVTRNLYNSSPRRMKPYIKVNCAALPEGLLESELFGYEKGAFTGAEQKKRGKFQLAHGGVLFLDEIGDMPFSLQSKLLHVLQSGEFTPLGSEKELRTDTWILAATNHDLAEDIKKKKFREDLYYRLNIIKIHIDPLRKRREDIPPLIDYYIKKYTSQFKNKHLLNPDHSVMKKLIEYHWPGNVRELQNVLKRFLVLGDWEEIIEGLQLGGTGTLTNLAGDESPAAEVSNSIDLFNLNSDNESNLESYSLKKLKKKALDRVEKQVISYVLDKTGWNRSKAAKILKISYKTLLYKISGLNIEPPQGL